MAFFGITALGAQNPFQVHLVNAIGLKVFSKEEFKDSFDRIDRDRSGFIEMPEVQRLLHETYGLEPLPEEIDMFMQEFDANQDGRISWEEFEGALDRIVNSLDQKAQQAAENSSYTNWNYKNKKHIRTNINPTEKYIRPVTWGQRYGFFDHQKVREMPEATRQSFFRTGCAETKYADSLHLGGHFSN